jgi:hypothetical protein
MFRFCGMADGLNSVVSIDAGAEGERSNGRLLPHGCHALLLREIMPPHSLLNEKSHFCRDRAAETHHSQPPNLPTFCHV